ncbi:MAG: dihydrofolate reductase family protein [Burkholderiaceae bacterium]|nr:dihydrofolate reductase family protein [Microbacteriaceae bacterium]
MILTRVVPGGDAGGPGSVDTDSDGARDDLRSWYAAPRPDWLRLNLICSVNGSAVGADGTSETLTNRADRAILGAIRSLADVILVGAASVRAEGYHLPKTARLAIVTASGDLAGHRILGEAAAGRILVLCPTSARESVIDSLGGLAADVVPVADDGGQLTPRAMLDALSALGLRHVVCEGGPALAVQMLDAGLVDELCLSTGPVLAGLPSTGGPLTALGVNIERRLRLDQLLVDDGSGLYARWGVTMEWPRHGGLPASR